jgi:sulfur carrier protein
VARPATILRMKITLNGEPREIDAQRSVLDLLAEAGYAGRRIAVEVNRTIVPRSEHASRMLSAGDHVEIVHAIGGG